MSDVIVIGGGPGGLSAALFTAKNGLETHVFDTDETWLHSAHLFNYLGIESISGDEFIETARAQVDDHGGIRHPGVEVVGVESTADGFVVETDDGTHEATYVVFATGTERDLAESVGCEIAEDGTVAVDQDKETSVEDAYAVGWTERKDKIQAAISVGGGAAAGLDILSKEAGEDVHDFDTPDDA